MNIDTLKYKWQTINADVVTGAMADGDAHAKGESEQKTRAAELLLEKIKTQRIKSLSSKLYIRYKRSGIISFFVPCLLIPISRDVNLSPFFLILYTATLFLLGAINLWVAHKVKNTNIYSLPVVEATRAVVRIRKLIMRCKILGIAVGLPAIITFFMEIADEGDEVLTEGAVVGAVLGLAIGLVMMHYVNRILKDMENSCKEP